MTPEILLLLHAVKFFQTGEKSNPSNIDFNPKRLLTLAKQHGLFIPLLYFAKVHLPENRNLLDPLKIHFLDQQLKTRKLNAQITSLSQALSQSAIPHAVLKGTAITHQLCSLKVEAWRPCVDLDILVAQTQLPKAVSTLQELGYASADYKKALSLSHFIAKQAHWVSARDMSFVSPNALFPIDLHWHAAYPFSLPLETEQALLQTESFVIEQSQTATPTEIHVPALAFELHFLLVCIHGYQDYFFRLKHLADVFFALHHPRFNQENVLSLAKDYGVDRQIEASIEAAHFFFDDAADTEKLSEKSAFTQKMVAHFLEHKGTAFRIQSHANSWSTLGKWRYIQKQIHTKSQHASALAPILQRLKLKLSELDKIEDIEQKKPRNLWFSCR